MPDAPPPGEPQVAAVDPPQALTRERIASALVDFHNWLSALAVTPEAELPPSMEGTKAPPDLHALLGQMIAVRQELNLQTRAVRSQQEQSAETLRALADAVERLEEAPPTLESANGASSDDAVRPLLKTLVDLYDALSLANREITRLRDSVLPELQTALGDESETEPAPEFMPPALPRLSWWQRLLGATDTSSAWHEAVTRYQERCHEQGQRERDRQVSRTSAATERVRRALNGVIIGYTMGLQRVERALESHGLAAIVTVGEPYDPEQMEVVEAVAESGYMSGEVVEEVRAGYLWNGRVFRCAQVRVAR